MNAIREKEGGIHKESKKGDHSIRAPISSNFPSGSQWSDSRDTVHVYLRLNLFDDVISSVSNKFYGNFFLLKKI